MRASVADGVTVLSELSELFVCSAMPRTTPHDKSLGTKCEIQSERPESTYIWCGSANGTNHIFFPARYITYSYTTFTLTMPMITRERKLLEVRKLARVIQHPKDNLQRKKPLEWITIQLENIIFQNYSTILT